MYWVYDNDDGTLITQEEWETIIRQEEIDLSGEEFYNYLQKSYTFKELFHMTDTDKEFVKDDYIHDYLVEYDFDNADRWTKIEDISANAEEQIAEQYVRRIKNLMKS